MRFHSRMHAARGDTAPLPNLLVIGAQKCGTTSLHAHLNAHPDVFMAPEKELDFFIRAEESLPTMPGNWGRGLDWYRSRFAGVTTAVRGESSPNYTVHPYVRNVAERAADVVPHAKLVYLVRDPVERAVSHYVHQVAAGRERRPIDEALAQAGTGAPSGYVLRSMYAMQLGRWLDVFPKDAVLVVAQEDLQREGRTELARVLSFVGVDPGKAPEEGQREVHRSADKRAAGAVERSLRRDPVARLAGRVPARVRAPLGRTVRAVAGRRIERPEMRPETRDALEVALREDAAALRGLTGRRFPDWSV